MPGSLVLVATPIGNLEDITLRALRVLKQVDLIAAEDTRRTGHLLTHFGILTPTTSLHDHNENTKVPDLIRQIQGGLRLAVVTDAGMPGVSDPGYLIVSAALKAGIQTEVVPGVSALTTALVGSGLAADDVRFLGFAPSRGGERKRWLAEKLGPGSKTTVLFEAPGRLQALLTDIHAVAGERWVVVAHELTKVHESWHRGWVSDLLAAEGQELPAKGEFVVLVSDQERPSTADRPPPEDGKVLEMFRRISAEGALSRREALHQVADAYRLPSKAVYAIIERAKLSVK